MSTLTSAGGLKHGISPVVVECKAFIRHEYIHLLPLNGGLSRVNERSHISHYGRSDGNTSHHVAGVVRVHVAVGRRRRVHVAVGRRRRVHHPTSICGIRGVPIVHALVRSIRRSSLHGRLTTCY